QRARQPDIPDDLARHRVLPHAQHALEAGAAHSDAAQQQYAGGQQQTASAPEGAAAVTTAHPGHRAVSARQRAMMRAASGRRGPGRTTTSDSTGSNTHTRCSRTAAIPCQPGYITMGCMLRLPTMITPGLARTTYSGFRR